jgi:hypothetical protein
VGLSYLARRASGYAKLVASYPRNRHREAQVNVGRQAATARRYLGELAEARKEFERMIGECGEPAPKLLWAIFGTRIFAVLMCAFGWCLPALAWILIGLVCAYNLVWMIVQDVVKLGIYRELKSRGKNRTPFLKHVKALVHPH